MTPHRPWDTHGYPRALWDQAKAVIRDAIINQIRRGGGPLTYTKVLQVVRPVIDLQEPRNPIFWSALGQIAEDEDDAGRGLLSAYVVRRDLNLPGDLYFNLAARRGRDTSNRVRCWTQEIDQLQSVWRPATNP